MISYTNIIITACCIVLLAIATRKKGISKEEKEIQRLTLEIKRRKLEQLLKDNK